MLESTTITAQECNAVACHQPVVHLGLSSSARAPQGTGPTKRRLPIINQGGSIAAAKNFPPVTTDANPHRPGNPGPAITRAPRPQPTQVLQRRPPRLHRHPRSHADHLDHRRRRQHQRPGPEPPHTAHGTRGTSLRPLCVASRVSPGHRRCTGAPERPRFTVGDRQGPRSAIERRRYRVLVCPVRVLARVEPSRGGLLTDIHAFA
jgi:hypothetical protein